MTPKEYFEFSASVNKKQYDSLHAFFMSGLSANEAAVKFGYKLSAFYSLVRDFSKYLKEGHPEDFFFKDTVLGRRPEKDDDLEEMIISLRKTNFSIEDIVGIANSKSYQVSYNYVYRILEKNGFARLPRRSEQAKKQIELPPLKAPEAEKLAWKPEKFHSSHTGLFSFLPIIFKYGIHLIIERSSYPATRTVNKLSSILCFLALKLSNIKRYSDDDLWCMDRGLGLFAHY